MNKKRFINLLRVLAAIVFPINLLVITGVIIAAASAVYWADLGIQRGLSSVFHRK